MDGDIEDGDFGRDSLGKRSERFWCTFIIMMVSYQMRNSFPCTVKSSLALCCSKVNVRGSIEPICDLRIAKFSHAPQF